MFGDWKTQCSKHVNSPKIYLFRFNKFPSEHNYLVKENE